ncbi:hypothetical protein [Polynucleobacter asymbioticus]|jgi:hypothetical protein|uniref:Lipoprotein n=1 Tax=Polynucleobacter asymbioticus TaxID=576611 RepID=A0AAC9IR11_9BURK|nr:hypothetical protein [Polynucleobacter asymbioticus]APB98452.1 hypothetical protein A4F89_03385 [Polynucleobacter asymbioticus]APC00736.1 hypothetical protein AOC25_03385 [Polynucleobacter asymbioticus]
MKILLVFTLSTVLLACTKKDTDLVLSCNGSKVVTSEDNSMVTDETRKYIFENKKLENYNCDWSSKTVVCYATNDGPENRSRSHLVYDIRTGSFTELNSTRVSANNRLINRTVFVGHCESPIFHYM